jgi:NADP-dependent 3-hydroxy acid dehydrogenase YdfG
MAQAPAPDAAPLDPKPILVTAIAARTGFPVESIGGDARLLDDLNLDSIKAAELIAQTAREVGIVEAVDPAPLANRSVDEVSEALRERTGAHAVAEPGSAPTAPSAAPAAPAGAGSAPTAPSAAPAAPAGAGSASTGSTSAREPASLVEVMREEVAAVSGFAKHSLSADTALDTDLILSDPRIIDILENVCQRAGKVARISTGALRDRTLGGLATVVAHLPDDTRPRPPETTDGERPREWVRDFASTWIEEPMLAAEDRGRLEEAWAQSRILVLADGDGLEVAQAFHHDALGRRAHIDSMTYDDLDRHGQAIERGYDQVICVLPATPALHADAGQLIRRNLRYLRYGALVPQGAPHRPTTLTYVQRSGHFRVRDGRRDQPNLVGTAAFAASLHHERPDLRVRVVEPHAALPATAVARHVIEEATAHSAPYASVAYDGTGARWVARPRLLEPCRYERRPVEWSPGDVVLITGGARGIAAECALAVARKHGFKAALVGSSKIEDSSRGPEITRTLERFAAEGLVARYYAADVSDRAQVERLVHAVRTELGPITGVVHGAGVNRPRRTEQASLDDAADEVAPKLLGAAHLAAALEHAPPKLFMALSSIIGVTGMPGNAYYAFSNQSLDELIHDFGARHPETSCGSIAYSVWDEIGMGARLGSLDALGRMGIGAIDVHQGVERFAKLFEATPGHSQVIVTARLGGLDTWNPIDHPVLPRGRFSGQITYREPNVEHRCRVHLTQGDDPYVVDHVFNGSALFPTVFGLEAMAQAAAAVLGVTSGERLVATHVRLQRPIVVDPQRGCTIEVRAVALERKHPDEPLEVQVGIGTEQTGGAIDHFSARISFAARKDASDTVTTAAPLSSRPKTDLYNEGGILFQGPLFQRITKLFELWRNEDTGEGGCTFEVTAKAREPVESPAFAGDLVKGLLLSDPFVFDAALQAGQLVAPQWVMLPVHIGRVEIDACDRPLHGTCRGRLKMHEQKGAIMPCSATVVDGDGRVVLRLEDYQVKVLGRKMSNPTANELGNPEARDQRVLSSQTESWAQRFGVRAPAIAVARMAGVFGAAVDRQPQHEPRMASRTPSGLNGRKLQ